MKIDLEFGVYDPEYGLEYSSDLEISGFEFLHIPPIGTRLRFDRPFQDDKGRYCLGFAHDGAEPMHAIVRELEIASNNEINGIAWQSLRVEVEQEDKTKKGCEAVRTYIKDLIKVRKYIGALELADKLLVDNAATGFDEKISTFLQMLGCYTLKEVASLTLRVFDSAPHKIDLIEKVLKKQGLMLYSGPAFTSYTHSMAKRAEVTVG